MQKSKPQSHEEDEARGVELRVIGGAAPSGWERVEDEVVRLKKTGVAGVRSTGDSEPAGHQPVSRHQKKMRRRQRALTISMVGLAGVLLIAAVVFVFNLRGDDPGQQDYFGGVEIAPGEGGTAADEFAQQTGKYLSEAQKILLRFVEAENRDDLGEAVLVEPGIPDLWAQGKRVLKFDEVMIYGMGIRINDDRRGRHWVELLGKSLDGRVVQCVFRTEAEPLKLDLAASLGASQMGLSALREADSQTEVVVRVVLEGEHFYTSAYPEERFRCFRISSADRREFGWVYAPVGSDVVEAVNLELNPGATLLESEAAVRMTLTIRAGAERQAGQFELIEVVSPNWIVWKEA